MPKFKYTGETPTGEKVEEVVDAKDRFNVYDIARTNGHTVSNVSEVAPFSVGRFIDMDKINASLSRVSQDNLAMATKNISSMLKAGLPLTRALAVTERQTKNPKLKKIVLDIRGRIDKGDPFNEALKEYPKVFSPLYTSMVRAGEESGGLADSLEIVASQIQRSSELTKRIRGAMIYPTIVVGVMVLIGILMMLYVMPTMTATFEQLDADLPATTQFLIASSTFLTENGLLSLLIAVTIIVATVWFSRTPPGRRFFHLVLIHFPIIGTLAKETNAARTGRTLSSLLSAGVDVINAIKITEDVVQNVYYKDILKEAAVRVEKGKPLSEPFMENEKFYPPLVGEMVSVGEETGQISKMLVEIATFYENEIEQKTKNLSTVIEPILMVVIGVTVGFFALAIIGPIYSISDSI